MTESTSSEVPGDESPILAAVQEAIAQSRALGLTWALRMATVVTTNPLTILYDGDTIVINAVSMVGPLAIGQRVYVLFVPPGGNFITGVTEVLTNRYIGMNCSTAGGLPAGSVGAEVAYPSASWDVAEDLYQFRGQRLFRAELEIAPNASSAAACWAIFRLRQGQATTSGTELARFYVQYPAGFAGVGFSNKQFCYFKNTGLSTITTYLSLTVDLDVGGGTFSIYGGDSTAPTMIVVQEVGSLEDSPLANMAIALV